MAPLDAKPKIVPLHKMSNGQESDCFVILVSKETLRTREGRNYVRVTFRDLHRDAYSLIWQDSPFYEDCNKLWEIGKFYKIRTLLRETGYGTRLDLIRVRETTEADKGDGFAPDDCRPSSRIPADLLMDEILTLARTHLPKDPLLLLVQRIFKEKRKELLEAPASRVHHHAYSGGLLEHTLSVLKLAIHTVDHFHSFYPAQRKKISKGLVIAGAILHDIGKIEEMEPTTLVPRHTPEGELIGHYILGRDIIRQYAPLVELDRTILLQLEHIILSHSRFSEWGTHRDPRSLEALIVHYANYAESTFSSALRVTEFEEGDSRFTSRPGPFGDTLFRPT